MDSNLVRTTFRLFIYGTKVDDYSIILCYFGCKVTMGLGTCWWSAHHAPSLPTRGIPRLAGRTPAHTTSKGAGVAARKQTALRAPLRLIIPYFLTLLTFKNSSEIAGGQRRSLQPRGWGGGRFAAFAGGGRTGLLWPDESYPARQSAWQKDLMCTGPILGLCELLVESLQEDLGEGPGSWAHIYFPTDHTLPSFSISFLIWGIFSWFLCNNQ